MKKRILGRTGLEVSVIGFGGIPIQGLSKPNAERVVRAALDAGINFIDSARGYTDSEIKIGGALGGRRDEVLLASKSMARSEVDMERDVETSLSNMGTDVIDLYQVHNPGDDAQLDAVIGPGGAYEALVRARDAGKIRFIGITGHSRSVLGRAVETGLFDTVQHPCNPLETAWLDDVHPAAKAAGLGTICMKPIAGGAFRDGAAAMRFSLGAGMDVLIPGMDTVEQVEENARVGRGPLEPTEEDLAQITAQKERWKGAFCRRCGYCMPCGSGLNIPFLFLIEAYYTRYGLKGWALDRLAGLDRKYADCVACGECVSRCPYDLDIPGMMKAAVDTVVE